jgi:hypothetical protein
MQVFEDSVGNANSVEGRRATAQFVHYGEGMLCTIIDEVEGFLHFDEKSGFPLLETVGGSQTGEDSVNQSDLAAVSRDKTP